MAASTRLGRVAAKSDPHLSCVSSHPSLNPPLPNALEAGTNFARMELIVAGAGPVSLMRGFCRVPALSLSLFSENAPEWEQEGEKLKQTGLRR